MSPDLSSFTSLCLASSLLILTTNSTPMPLIGVGSVVTPHLFLSSVYYIPNLSINLIFVGQLCDAGYLVTFSSTFCHVQDPQS